MEIKIIETYRNHTFIDYLKQSVRNLFAFLIGLIIIPALLISKLFKKKNNSLVDEHSNVENKWHEFIKSERLVFLRELISDNELPENLELPEEPSDVYAFKIKTEPNIEEIEDLIFSLNYLETEKNIYLISINKIGEGMSLWNINKRNNAAKAVANLKSLWWDFSTINNKIFLKATDKNKDRQIEIVER